MESTAPKQTAEKGASRVKVSIDTALDFEIQPYVSFQTVFKGICPPVFKVLS